jgi:hypothetical protein
MREIVERELRAIAALPAWFWLMVAIACLGSVIRLWKGI